jgi:hypothetical protein
MMNKAVHSTNNDNLYFPITYWYSGDSIKQTQKYTTVITSEGH